MKILVYEHISGGGCAGQPVLMGVLAEGFAMLRSFVSDLKSAGNEVTVLLDGRLLKLNPLIVANSKIPVFYPKDLKEILVDAAKTNDAAYVIAPETGQTLQSLVAFEEQTGKVSLNCESGAIGKVADKTALYETFEKKGLSTPYTLALAVESDISEIKQTIRGKFSYPVVLKPPDGVSCNGLSFVKEEAQVKGAIAKIKAVSEGKTFLVQEFIGGETASVSLLCAGGRALAISLNKQNVKVAASSEASNYKGGTVPFDHPIKKEAFKVAEKAIECFPGLKGYVGIDLILGEDAPFIVDVNPRLTTSYVGLCKVAAFNVGEALVNAVLKGTLPAKPEVKGFICFSKVETPKPTLDEFEKAVQMLEVVSPPFPLSEDEKSCSLVAAQGDSSLDAHLRFEEAKKRLLNIICRGK